MLLPSSKELFYLPPQPIDKSNLERHQVLAIGDNPKENTTNFVSKQTGRIPCAMLLLLDIHLGKKDDIRLWRRLSWDIYIL